MTFFTNRIPFLSIFFIGSFLLTSAAQTKPVEEEEKEPRMLNIAGGIFNVLHGRKAFTYQFEYRSDFEIYRSEPLFIRPLMGLMGTTDGNLYIYGGLAFDIFVGKYVVITPSFAPGVYFQGKHGKDLGFPLEFRSSLELSGVVHKKSRVGVQFYHISNASLGSKNPGTECLMFFYGIPL